MSMFEAIHQKNACERFSIPKWNIVEKHWYIWNHVYGWCVPTTLTMAVYITSIVDGGFDPGFGEKSCWFQGVFYVYVLPHTQIVIT